MFDNEYAPGKVIFPDTEYKEVYIKNDIYEQNLIVYSRFGTSLVSTILPNEFLSEFKISNKHFKKYSFNNEAPKYYQIVAKTNELSCLY